MCGDCVKYMNTVLKKSMKGLSSILHTYVQALKSSCLFSWQCNIYMQLGYKAVGWMTEESWFDSW